ncbi:hypothetical protein [Endozoicomonas atrinae]|uniref:hypothetical protein n=1 Tax=Endozoicomonas atrinae TaxID=1333660 RepID=UPI003B00672F
MNTEPNKERVRKCVDLMAHAMGLNPLPEDKSNLLIKHVLFDAEYEGIEGKNGWGAFTSSLITERELRNLLMAHSATKIANYNKVREPGTPDHISKELCNGFELALFGRSSKLLSIDNKDPWERNA